MRYRLELVGITFNQIESGVYALILQQAGGRRRIPIVIGFPEAQAIQCKLQEVATPRPLTHDTMVNTLSVFGIELKEVEIYKLPSGVFAANLHFSDGVNNRIVDARSSDAVALAIRTGAPIFTSESVLSESGFDPEPDSQPALNSKNGDDSPQVNHPNETDISKMSLEQLSDLMLRAADNEDYEEAARIKEEINKRQNQNGEQ